MTLKRRDTAKEARGKMGERGQRDDRDDRDDRDGDERDVCGATCDFCLAPMHPRTRIVRCLVCGADLHTGHAAGHFLTRHSQWGWIRHDGSAPKLWHSGRPKTSPWLTPLARYARKLDGQTSMKKNGKRKHGV